MSAEKRERAGFAGSTGQTALCLLVVALVILLSSCVPTIVDKVIRNTTEKKPVPESVLISKSEVGEAVLGAIKEGKHEMVLDIATGGIPIGEFASNFDPFYGAPSAYRIESSFDNIVLSEGAAPVTVMRVKFQLIQSDNWYVLKLLENPSFKVPADNREHVLAVANALPDIIGEIYGEDGVPPGLSDYKTTLKVHDWLVKNVKYDEQMPPSDPGNSAYGALIDRSTLCQGYAEAFELILLVASNIDVRMEIGDGDSGDGIWVGHAWNIVRFGDLWYQVDTTFDDQIGRKETTVDHFYFGQNDTIMSEDHSWDESLWPSADGKGFLYYRKSGLLVKNMDGFREAVRKKLDKKKISHIEVAAKGFDVSDDELQFIYREYPSVENIYRSSELMDDVRIISLQLEY